MASYSCLNNRVFCEMCGPQTDGDSHLECCAMRNLGSFCTLCDIRLLN